MTLFSKTPYSLHAAFIAAFCFSPVSSSAPIQGNLGSTSTGSFDISVELPNLVQVTRLDDVNFGVYSGTGNLVTSESFCVYRNGSGVYQATMTGSGTGGAFDLVNGSSTLSYTLTYDDGSGANPVTPGTALTSLAGEDSNVDCNNTDNATIGVTLQESDLQSSTTGVYSGTLTIIIAPE